MPIEENSWTGFKMLPTALQTDVLVIAKGQCLFRLEQWLQ